MSKDFVQRATDCLELGVDLENRTLYIVGDLGEDKGHKYVALFQMLDSTPGPIKVVIISGGGYEQVGYALYDAIRLADNEVTTIGLGHVHSIAALVLQAGAIRALSPECTFMIHNGTLELEGSLSSNEVVGLGEEARMHNEHYHSILQRHSGQPLKVIREWCLGDKYFSAAEAVKNGFADKVMKYPERKKK